MDGARSQPAAPRRRRAAGSWSKLAIDNGISNSDEQYLIVVVILYLVLGAVGWVLSAMLIRGVAGIGQEIVLGLRQDLFDHLTSLSLRYFSEQRAGWIIARLTSDVDAVSEVLSQDLPRSSRTSSFCPPRPSGSSSSTGGWAQRR